MCLQHCSTNYMSQIHFLKYVHLGNSAKLIKSSDIFKKDKYISSIYLETFSYYYDTNTF